MKDGLFLNELSESADEVAPELRGLIEPVLPESLLADSHTRWSLFTQD